MTSMTRNDQDHHSKQMPPVALCGIKPDESSAGHGCYYCSSLKCNRLPAAFTAGRSSAGSDFVGGDRTYSPSTSMCATVARYMERSARIPGVAPGRETKEVPDCLASYAVAEEEESCDDGTASPSLCSSGKPSEISSSEDKNDI
jgi:hypothetical protein